MNKAVHIFYKNNFVCLYNSLTLDIAYIKREDFINQHLADEIKDFLPQAIISDIDYLREIKKNLNDYLHPSITTMFLFLNEICNMHCKYCRYINKLPYDFCGKILNLETGKRQIEKFLLWNKDRNKKKTIVFFGTEVLIQKRELLELARYVRLLEKKFQLPKTEVIVFTNGVLLNEEIALFLKKNNIVPIVSIDGWKELHDSARVMRDGSGTYEIISKNCLLMKQIGLKFGISLAVGEHNIEYLSEIVEYLVEQFQPLNIGMNPMEIDSNIGREIFFEKYIRNGIEAYKVARERGISIPQIMRRIRPFVEKIHRIKECPTCGGAIRVYPTGKIGTCSHFISQNKECISEKEYLSTNFEENELFKRWSCRTQFNFDKCRDCEAISLCGGGCVYNAWLQSGKQMTPDDRICIHSKLALEWCIWDLFELAKGNREVDRKRIFVPSVESRKLIYGKIDEKSSNLPLQAYNTYGEVRLFYDK